MISSWMRPRRWTRTRMSPARTRRRPCSVSISSPCSSQSRMRPAMAAATRRSGSSVTRGRSGSGQLSGSRSSSAGVASGQTSTRPGRVLRLVSWRTVSPSVTPAAMWGWSRTRSTTSSTAREERKERSSVSRAKARRAAVARSSSPCAHAAEVLEVGTLEAVDRLLLVADDEEGAVAGMRPDAGQELLGQLLDDRPLARARVLRLVDQDVLEPLVELVEHPVAPAGGLQEADGVLDQVVEVEEGALRASGARTRG